MSCLREICDYCHTKICTCCDKKPETIKCMGCNKQFCKKSCYSKTVSCGGGKICSPCADDNEDGTYIRKSGFYCGRCINKFKEDPINCPKCDLFYCPTHAKTVKLSTCQICEKNICACDRKGVIDCSDYQCNVKICTDCLKDSNKTILKCNYWKCNNFYCTSCSDKKNCCQVCQGFYCGKCSDGFDAYIISCEKCKKSICTMCNLNGADKDKYPKLFDEGLSCWKHCLECVPWDSLKPCHQGDKCYYKGHRDHICPICHIHEPCGEHYCDGCAYDHEKSYCQFCQKNKFRSFQTRKVIICPMNGMVGDNGQNYCTPECLANDILYEEICQKKKALEKLMD